MHKKANFTVDATNFALVKDEVGVGKIVELPAADASLLAPHIEEHPHTIYVAASGVSLGGQYGVFRIGEQQVAVEWVRKRPSRNRVNLSATHTVTSSD